MKSCELRRLEALVCLQERYSFGLQRTKYCQPPQLVGSSQPAHSVTGRCQSLALHRCFGFLIFSFHLLSNVTFN